MILQWQIHLRIQTLKMASSSTDFTTDEIMNLIDGNNGGKEQCSLKKQKRKKSIISVKITKNDHAMPTTKFYGDQARFTVLKDALNYIDENREETRTMTILPPESGCLNVPSENEEDFSEK